MSITDSDSRFKMIRFPQTGLILLCLFGIGVGIILFPIISTARTQDLDAQAVANGKAIYRPVFSRIATMKSPNSEDRRFSRNYPQKKFNLEKVVSRRDDQPNPPSGTFCTSEKHIESMKTEIV